MAGRRLTTEAAMAAQGGGPPLPLPDSLEDMAPILARWPLMLKYHPPTGDLWWKYIVETHNFESLDPRQYIATYRSVVSNRARHMVRVDGFTVEAAKVVWLLHHGEWPPGRLVRLDDNFTNDRIENLKVAESKDRTIGKRGRVPFRPLGVTKFYDRWRAYADIPGVGRRVIGQYATMEEAAAARLAWDAKDVSDLV